MAELTCCDIENTACKTQDIYFMSLYSLLSSLLAPDWGMG